MSFKAAQPSFPYLLDIYIFGLCVFKYLRNFFNNLSVYKNYTNDLVNRWR